MANNPTFTPRGGKTTQEDIDAGRHEYTNGAVGIKYYHVAGNILMAAKKKFPQFKSLTEEQFKEELRKLNPHLTDKEGRKCTDKTKFTDLMIPRDKPLVLPEGMNLGPNDVQFYYECPPPPKKSAQVKVDAPALPAPVVKPNLEDTTLTITRFDPVIPLAQVIPNTGRYADELLKTSQAMYFLGRPPQDAAAKWKGREDDVARGLKPGTQEGTLVNTGDPRGLIARTFGSDKDQLKLSRADIELRMKPSQLVLIDDNGNVIGPNPNVPSKMETGGRLAIDPDGEIRAVLDTHALISENRREKPDYRGFSRDAFVARNHIDKLTNTGMGQVLFATYLRIGQAYEKIGGTYFDPKGTPTFENAQKLGQLVLQECGHPLCYSPDSLGVPTSSVDVLRARLIKIRDTLPKDEDRARFTEQYINPYIGVLNDPIRLHAAFEARGGRKGWINPMVEWAEERAKEDHVKEGYGDVPISEAKKKEKLGSYYNNPDHPGAGLGAKEIRELREEETLRVGKIYAKQMWEEAIRPPVKSEIELGTGLLHDAQGQREVNLAPKRLELLMKLRNDPVARAAWIEHMLATPGGLENITTLLHFSSDEKTGNYKLLNFKDAQSARAGAFDITSKLAGKEQAKELMREEVSGWRTAGHFITGGIVDPDTGLNQTKGNFGTQEEVRKLWKDDKTKGDVDAGALEILDRVIATQKAGIAATDDSTASKAARAVGTYASSKVLLTMDRNRAEDLARQGLSTDKTYAGVLKALGNDSAGKPFGKTLDNQMVTNLNLAGNRDVTAALARDAALRADARTVTPEEATGAIAKGSVVIAGAAAGVPAANRLTTLLTGNAAANLLKAGLTTNPAQVTQAEMNASVLRSATSSSPATTATLLVSAMIAAEKAGNKALVESLKAQVDNLASGSLFTTDNGKAGEDLAALISQQVVKAADGSAASLTAANASFAAFFGDKDNAKINAIAANVLTSSLATNPQAAAAVVVPLQAQSQALFSALPEGARAQLQAINLMDPAKQADALKAFAVSYADTLNAVNAGGGFSPTTAGKLLLLVAALSTGGSSAQAGPTPVKPNPVGREALPGCCGLPTSIFNAPTATPIVRAATTGPLGF